MSAETSQHPFRNIQISNTTKVDAVISFLEECIEEEGINIGDRLPYESEIAERTGISRTCVREALTRLRAMGIIESRRHSGTKLVCPISAHNFMRVLSSRTLPDVAFGHAGGLRSAIELGLSQEIFNRTTDEDIRSLRQICRTMHNSVSSRESFMACETQFHSKLIQITENALAISLWQMMEPFFRRIAPIRIPIPNPIIAKHDRIVDALEASDEDAFKMEMHIHHDNKLAWDSKRYDKNFLDPQYLDPEHEYPTKYK